MTVRSLIRSLTFVAGCALAPLGLAAQAGAASAIPLDSAVRVGVLPNGLTYYIRKNSRPRERAEFRLVVNAGSIVEDEDQRGLAHFVEHMLFNGTARYKKNDIIKYLESIGVRFGADLNAQTGFDETIYILPVPTDKPELITGALDILKDWSDAALFDSVEVVAERGVVMEEWRGGLGAGSRIRDQQFPVIFKGSRYAERLPIGLPAILESANPAPLKRFYRDWYRPNLMAVVAVGDFDPATIERMIRDRFSQLSNPPNARPRVAYPVPGNSAPLVTIATDDEEQVSTVGVLYKHAPRRQTTVADYRNAVIGELYSFMFNQRLGELARRAETPFSVASTGYGSFVRGTDAYQVVAVAKEGETVRTLEYVLFEAQRIRQHGFLSSELERAKTSILRAYESAYSERDQSESSGFAGEYIDHFLTGAPSPGIAWEYQQIQTLVPQLTLGDVNALGTAWLTPGNRVITLSAPAPTAAAATPTAEQLLAGVSRAEAATVAAWTEETIDGPLVAQAPAPGRIVSERTIADIGVTEWTLSNGIRFFLKPTDFKADEVMIRGWSPGGTSLLSDADLPSAALATAAVDRSGAGAFDAVALGKRLQGKQVSAGPFIDDLEEGISAGGTPQNMELLFELIHLKLTSPRRDSAAFAAFRAQVRPFFANRDKDPQQAFADTILLTMGGNHPRVQPVNLAFLDRVSYDRAMEISAERFADFSDYTFVMVGSMDPTAVRPFVEQWIASLPTTRAKEQWRDVGPKAPTGPIEKFVRRGVEPKAETLIIMHGPAEYTPAERYAMRSLGEYLEMRLLDNLREVLGGTYSVSAGGQLERIPTPRYSFRVSFGSAPERADQLWDAVRAVIDSVKSGPITDEEIGRLREQQLRQLEVSLRENSYWMSNLSARLESGEDLGGLLTYAERIRALTPATIRAAAEKYLAGNNIARFVLLPER